MPATGDSFASFAATFNAGKRQLVHRVLVADTQTPVSAYLKLASDKTNCFLLESVEGGEVRGRFSMIGPDLVGAAVMEKPRSIEHPTTKVSLSRKLALVGIANVLAI